MKFSNYAIGFAIALLMSAPQLQAQVLPGEGGGCDQLCGTVYQNGVPIGHSCVSGGDRNRTNCQATVDACTTDPCGGFAVLNSSGIVLAVGTCGERSIVEKDPLAIINRLSRAHEALAPSDVKAVVADKSAKRSATE